MLEEAGGRRFPPVRQQGETGFDKSQNTARRKPVPGGWICQKVRYFATEMFRELHALRESSNNFGRFCKLFIHGLQGVEAYTGRECLPILSKKMDNTETVTGLFQIAPDAKYFYTGEWLKDLQRKVYDTRCKFFAQVAFTSADGLSILDWLDKFKLISLENLSKGIQSKASCFKIFDKIGMEKMIRGTVAAGFTFLGVDAISKIRLANVHLKLCSREREENYRAYKTHARLELTWAISEVVSQLANIALKIWKVEKVGKVPVKYLLPALGCVSALIGLGAGVYRNRNKKQIEEASEGVELLSRQRELGSLLGERNLQGEDTDG